MTCYLHAWRSHPRRQLDGQQGDAWDSRKDMATAIVGAAVAALWQGRRAI